MKPTVRPTTGAGEYQRLVDIWRSAVDATHDFVSAADLRAIESRLASDYFPAVTLTVAEIDGTAVGFAGVVGSSLEMLFVDADHRGLGVGTALLAKAIREQGITRVDVNEQNTGATGFFTHHGFVIVSRSETDDDGRPYPILHLGRDA